MVGSKKIAVALLSTAHYPPPTVIAGLHRKCWSLESRTVFMVAIAQLVERQIVVLDVAGSSPVSHPSQALPADVADEAFFLD